MNNILSEIISHKRAEIKMRKKMLSLARLKEKAQHAHTHSSLVDALSDSNASGIIAEYKLRSPSEGVINLNADVTSVTRGYLIAGASALSVLTDNRFFGGSFENFNLAREENICPIIQKDFIINEYQVYESRSLGADAILLIASALKVNQVCELASLAKSLGMETILEVHTIDELEYLCSDISIVGINNRNLKTFTVNLMNSVEIADRVPEGYMKIAESGIEKPEDVIMLRRAGFNGFLIGSHFMKTSDPAKACKDFIQQLSILKPVKCL